MHVSMNYYQLIVTIIYTNLAAGNQSNEVVFTGGEIKPTANGLNFQDMSNLHSLGVTANLGL